MNNVNTDSSVGNAAAMREALLALQGLIEDEPDGTPWVDAAKATIEAALSAPPRQCDVGTAAEQSERMEKFVCSKHYGCVRCQLRKAKYSDCSLVWAQTPYEEERKGESDGV